MPEEIVLQLSHKDVFLDFFKNIKQDVLALRSGDPLILENAYFGSTLLTAYFSFTAPSADERKKQKVIAIRNWLNQSYGEGTVTVELRDSYRNMKEIVEQYPEILERARKAFLENGVDPLTQPIRGGTDGARLSFMGLPCPNLSTGGYNFHGRKELIPVPAMEKMVDVLTSLVSLNS